MDIPMQSSLPSPGPEEHLARLEAEEQANALSNIMPSATAAGIPRPVRKSRIIRLFSTLSRSGWMSVPS